MAGGISLRGDERGQGRKLGVRGEEDCAAGEVLK